MLAALPESEARRHKACFRFRKRYSPKKEGDLSAKLDGLGLVKSVTRRYRLYPMNLPSPN